MNSYVFASSGGGYVACLATFDGSFKELWDEGMQDSPF